MQRVQVDTSRDNRRQVVLKKIDRIFLKTKNLFEHTVMGILHEKRYRRVRHRSNKIYLNPIFPGLHWTMPYPAREIFQIHRRFDVTACVAFLSHAPLLL